MNGDPYPCNHIDEETGERCRKGYQSESKLLNHMVKAHGETNNERTYICIMCAAPGSEFEEVTTATGVVMVAKEPLAFTTFQELTAHSNEVHPPICPECSLKCKTKEILKSHIVTVHSNPEDRPKFPCPRPGCERVFNKENNLKVHIRAVHEQRKNFFCNASFFTDSKKADLKAWDGKNACEAPFGAKSSLEQHVRTHHLGLQNRKQTRKIAKSKAKPAPSALRLLTGLGFDGGRNVPCLVHDCYYNFFLDRDLRRHLRAVHEMEEHEIEEMIIERNALQGGQFWIGGAEEPMFESTETSFPQTPDSLQFPNDYNSALGPQNNQDVKAIDPRLTSLGKSFEPFNLSTDDADEAAMDEAMGLEQVQSWDLQSGLPMP
jgi:general transcription factor IIIA